MSAEPVVAYLTELRGLLDGSPRNNERLVEEVEEHLHDATEAALLAGLSAEAAAQDAVLRMGPARATAVAAAATAWRPSLVIRGAAHMLRLGALLLVVLGVNGLLGEPISWVSGMDFYFGDERTLPVSPQRCARLLRLQPEQTTCNGALVEHHFGEYVEHGWAALIFGLLLLGAVRVWRFRYEPLDAQRRWFERAGLLAAVVQFSLLAAVRLPRGILGTLRDPNLGAGRALSEGVVCATAAVVLAAVAVHLTRQRSRLSEGSR